MTWLIATLSLFATWLNIKKIRACFAIWMITNITWANGKSSASYSPDTKILDAIVVSNAGVHRGSLQQVSAKAQPELASFRTSVPDDQRSRDAQQEFAAALEKGADWWESGTAWEVLATPEAIAGPADYTALIRPAGKTQLKVPAWWSIMAVLKWLAFGSVVAGLIWAFADPLAIELGEWPVPFLMVLGGVLVSLLAWVLGRSGGARAGRKSVQRFRGQLKQALKAQLDRRIGQSIRLLEAERLAFAESVEKLQELVRQS